MPPARTLAVVLLLSSGCATGPSPKPMTTPLPTRAAPSPAPVPIQLASTAPPAGDESSFIGKETLDEARSLLSEARNELEPRQWELLDNKLTEAERAFERFNRVAGTSGRVARVARGAEGAADTGRAGEASEGLRAGARAGPLLALLILLWPAETAGPEYDHGPDWLPPEQDFKAKLREVSKAAQQVKSELAAARRGPPVEAARRKKPPETPEVTVPFPDWRPEPGQRWDGPCFWKGTEGRGPNVPPDAPPDWIACIYQCGRYQVKVYVLGKSGVECESPSLMERAQRQATRFHIQHGRDR